MSVETGPDHLGSHVVLEELLIDSLGLHALEFLNVSVAGSALQHLCRSCLKRQRCMVVSGPKPLRALLRHGPGSFIQ